MKQAKFKITEKGGRMTLPLCTKLAYSVGHVLNDLCASMWFSYLILFFNSVLGLSNGVAGGLMLVGQIADALSTPFVGFCSDRGSVFCCFGYGRRKSWHLLGTICVLASFPFIFSQCIECEDSDTWAKVLYYSTFICLFQFGWASVQISNLSVVPELTPDENERTALLAYRYTFTVISNMAVYVITWIALTDKKEDYLNASDSRKFQFVMFCVVSIGILTSIMYHLGVPESNRNEQLINSTNEGDDANQIVVKVSTGDLFKNIHLYKVAIVYMSTRLFVNMSQVLIPLYIHAYLYLPPTSIAIVPLTVFISSFITSLIIKPLNAYLGRKVSYVIGCIIGISASVWVYFGYGALFNKYLVNVVAALFGCGGSIMLVTSLGITADLIGKDCDNGAFIYGIMSFLDKLSNGTAVMVIQSSFCVSCLTHYRDSLAYVCGVSAVIGILAILTFKDIQRRGDYIQETEGIENESYVSDRRIPSQDVKIKTNEEPTNNLATVVAIDQKTPSN